MYLTQTLNQKIFNNFKFKQKFTQKRFFFIVNDTEIYLNNCWIYMHTYTSIKIYKCAVILGNLLQYKADENN